MRSNSVRGFQFKCGSRLATVGNHLYVLMVSILLLLITSCSTPYFKNDYEDNSPTSGKLKVYYDEGLQLHIKNQEYTFEALYPNANVELFTTSENLAVEALYNDSCKAIMISRLLSDEERKAFESKNLFPKYTAVAQSGVALITNIDMPLKVLTCSQVKELLGGSGVVKDSSGKEIKLNVLFDKKNSSVMHYLLDTILKGEKFASHCKVLGSTQESIDHVATNKNTIAFIDFAWLSDVDDSIYKANAGKIKFLAVGKTATCLNEKGTYKEKIEQDSTYEYPSPNSFKLGTYPYIRTIYVYRRSGEFTLGKGFESFIAGPKGQVTFLKQGLLPTRQQERIVKVNMEPVKTE